MCGIAGLVKFDPQEIAEDARVKRMRDVLRHRGPDGEGLLIDGPAGLGHRRLAIVDPAGGHQPMANAEGTTWIVYNGETYNHPGLMADLVARGRRYATRSDTETILHLYDLLGDACVEHLRGMFAFALWDRSRQRILLARDRLGIKPLYYAVTPHELLFASEIKALVAAGIRPVLNEAVLPELLATGFVTGEQTLFRGILKLLPGTTLSWSRTEGLHRHRYWRPPVAQRESRSFADAAAEVRRELSAAVQSHLMSDVPLGVFLSGGIDSSAIAAIMARSLIEPVRTFSVGFDDPVANELPWARQVARLIGAEHHEVIVSPEEFRAVLPQLVWHEDEPLAFSAGVPLYFVSRLAREHVKVVLTGEGSDEIFLGYNRYRVAAWNARLGRLWSATVPGPARRGVERLASALPRPLERLAARSFLGRGSDLRALYHDNFAVFSEARQRRLLAEPALLDAHDPYRTVSELAADGPDDLLARLSHVDLQSYLVELLMKQDRMSMAASVESRVPFLDHVFVERVMALPSALKLRGWRTKAVLKAALPDYLPPEILHRRKMGFPVPVDRWFRGPLRPLAEHLVGGPQALGRGLFVPNTVATLVNEHLDGRANHGTQLWLLANLEIWQRIFLDGAEPEDSALLAAR